MSIPAPLLGFSGRLACILWGTLIIWIAARSTVIHLPQDSAEMWNYSRREQLQWLGMALFVGLFLIVFGVMMPGARFGSRAVGVFFEYSGPFAVLAMVGWARVSILELRIAHYLRHRQGQGQGQGQQPSTVGEADRGQMATVAGENEAEPENKKQVGEQRQAED